MTSIGWNFLHITKMSLKLYCKLLEKHCYDRKRGSQVPQVAQLWPIPARSSFPSSAWVSYSHFSGEHPVVLCKGGDHPWAPYRWGKQGGRFPFHRSSSDPKTLIPTRCVHIPPSQSTNRSSQSIWQQDLSLKQAAQDKAKIIAIVFPIVITVLGRNRLPLLLLNT